jgi:putative oxidoreductase
VTAGSGNTNYETGFGFVSQLADLERIERPVMESIDERPLAGPAQVSGALLAIRIASALAFLFHGSAILFGAFGGPGPVKFAAFLQAHMAVGYLVGLAEFCGGLAMLTGVFTRIGSAAIIIVMLGAIFHVHLPHGYDIGHGGYEYALTQLLIAVAILLAGPGRYSLASMLPPALRRL